MHRRNRLGSSSLIRRVHAEGTRVRTGPLSLTGLIRDGGEPQVAFIASRRIGGAVVRNRARRRLRAALRPQIQGMKPGSTVVIAASAQTASTDFQVLETELARALERAGLRTGAR